MTEHQFSAINAVENPAEPAADLWRHEVQARIAGYKKRRGRRVEGAFSMRFPFPADEVVAAIEPAEEVSAIAEPAIGPEAGIPEAEPEGYIDTVPRPRPKRKVIAFPRHLSAAPETVYRLADPVISEAPRILDVPEELEAIPTTPFLDGLQLDQV